MLGTPQTGTFASHLQTCAEHFGIWVAWHMSQLWSPCFSSYAGNKCPCHGLFRVLLYISVWDFTIKMALRCSAQGTQKQGYILTSRRRCTGGSRRERFVLLLQVMPQCSPTHWLIHWWPHNTTTLTIRTDLRWRVTTWTPSQNSWTT